MGEAPTRVHLSKHMVTSHLHNSNILQHIFAAHEYPESTGVRLLYSSDRAHKTTGNNIS
jgi:hypothetical protein